MSIWTDAMDRARTHKDSVSAPKQRRMEFGPTASRVAQKRASKAARMLERLRCGPATTFDLMMLGGAGFSSRLHELREAGHRIECEQGEGGATYRLICAE